MADSLGLKWTREPLGMRTWCWSGQNSKSRWRICKSSSIKFWFGSPSLVFSFVLCQISSLRRPSRNLAVSSGRLGCSPGLDCWVFTQREISERLYCSSLGSPRSTALIIKNVFEQELV